VDCGGGGGGADAGVEELHIVARHEAHPQAVEQSGEGGSARWRWFISGSNTITVAKRDVQDLAQSLRTLGRRGDFL